MTDSTAAVAQPTPTLAEQFTAYEREVYHFHAAHAAAELELAEHLANGPLSVEELASQTKTHAPSLFRLLRALETIGVFKQVSPRVFANTPESERLRKGTPGSLWARVRALFACGFYQAWMGFPDSIRTGRNAFEQVHGCSSWEFNRRDPERAAIFDQFMQSYQAMVTPPVTAAYDWARFPVIADVGGGKGAQLVDILRAHPSCRGILLDQPHVVASATPHDRIERVGGSFFDRVPSGADAYILRSVIHDWGDAESVAILKTVHVAMRPESRAILIEQIIPEGPGYAFTKWVDLAVMTIAGGQERTAAEYRHLLEEAGFEVEQIVPTSGPLNLIISHPRT